jgi:hypothetical protein
MPVPQPGKSESQADYLERGHKALASEFPETDQRNAVLFSTWRKHHGDSEEEKKAHERFSDDEYQHLKDIPVFKEHSYFRTMRNKDGSPALDKDGNPIQRVEHYDLKALKAIAENCNKRVRETKSFAPITALHTGKRKPNGEIEQPEVMGFAGPYRIGMYGNEEREDGAPYKGKWAIYADEFWFKDKAHRAREMPRRSPEVYVGRPIEDRFLDPITALGAETPALDMGIHYHLNKSGVLVEQYSAPNMTVTYSAMPGPASVAVPEHVKGKAQYDEYSEEDLQPIRDKVRAFHQENIKHHTDELEKAKIAGDKAGIKKHTMHLAFHQREHDAMPSSLKISPEMPKGDELRQNFSQEMRDVVARYTADPETVNACVEAMLQTQIVKRIEQFLDSQDAPVNPKQEMEQQAAQAIVEQEEGLPTQEQVQGKEQIPGETPQPGDAPPPGGEQTVEVKGAGSEPGEEPEEPPAGKSPPPDKKKGKKMPDAAAAPATVPPEEKEKFALQELRRDFQIQNDDLKAKYDAQQAQISQLLEVNTALKTERNQAVRERKIIELRRAGYVFNEREEIAKYSQSSEEVFQARLDAIVCYAERAPLDTPQLYTPGLDIPEPQRGEVAQYGGASLSETEEIVQYQLKKQQDGEYLSWEEAKERYEAKKEKKARKAAAV